MSEIGPCSLEQLLIQPRAHVPQLPNLCATARETVSHNKRSHMVQRRPCMLQLRLDTVKQINKYFKKKIYSCSYNKVSTYQHAMTKSIKLLIANINMIIDMT